MPSKTGNPFGTHRVIEPAGVLPQPALKLDSCMDYLYDNEIMVNAEILNIDSASFTQLKKASGEDPEKIKTMILDIVNTRGKMQNPVTGSGGMLVGTVNSVGKALRGKIDLAPGDRIASLVSLSLTPLKISKILKVHLDTDQVEVEARAVLFESGIYVKLPEDIPMATALAVLDVCGAPAQVARLVKPSDTVAVMGAGGKSGILCGYMARKGAGSMGRVIGIESSPESIKFIEKMGFYDRIISLDARDALSCYETVLTETNGRLADIVINCVNIDNTEMASIMICRQRGTVYFFSMATSFTRAALGAEGIGKDIDMLIGNGYAEGHAEIALNILRESPQIRRYYENLYG